MTQDDLIDDARNQEADRASDQGPVPFEVLDEVVDWLTSELRRPVVRHVWRSTGGDAITHCWWDVDGGVAETIVSGPPYVRLEPATADETTRLVHAHQSPLSTPTSSSSPRSG